MANPYGRYGKAGAFVDFIIAAIIAVIIIIASPFLIIDFISQLFDDKLYLQAILCILVLTLPLIILIIVLIVKYIKQNKDYNSKLRNETNVLDLVMKIKKNDTPNEVTSLLDMIKGKVGVVLYNKDNQLYCSMEKEQRYLNFYINAAEIRKSRLKQEQKNFNDFFNLKFFDSFDGIKLIYNDQFIYLYKKHFEHYISNSLTTLVNKYDASRKCLGNYKVNIFSNKTEIYHQTSNDTSTIISYELLVKSMHSAIYSNQYLNIEFEIQNKKLKQEYSNLIDGFISLNSNYSYGSPSIYGKHYYKTNAGTTRNFSMAEIGITNHKTFKTNIQLFILDYHHTVYVYSPTMIFIVKPNKIIKYNEISYTIQTDNIVSSETLDSEVVGYRWKYINKDGTRDKRYNDNKHIPLCKYGIVTAFYKKQKQYSVAGSNFMKTKKFYEALVSYSKYFESQ